MNAVDLVKEHNKLRERTVNLQASENYLSEEVRFALSSDMASRYSMVFDAEVHGSFVHNAYGGARYQEQITELAESLAKEVFGFEHVNVKPISGHVAAMSVLVALAKRGDKIMAISPEDGGYDGYSQAYMPNMLGLKYKPLIIEGLRYIPTEQILSYRPSLVILGASYILFPYNLKEILDAAEDIHAKVVYDASHVLGLLPAGFQEGIERCHVVYGSTHKSYPGPQGGIIMTNDEKEGAKIESMMTWRTQDNYHTNRVAALAVSLEEFKHVSKIYGTRVKENSQTLAKELHSKGLEIKYPPKFTESHQLLVDTNALMRNYSMSPVEMSGILEKNSIIVDNVGRIGTAEITWRGYSKEDILALSDYIVDALAGKSVVENVRKLADKYHGKTLGKA